eukprot:401569-Prymnesium_polylepis.1
MTLPPPALEAVPPPAFKRMKLSFEGAPASTGLTRYMGETSLLFSEDKTEEDDEGIKYTGATQSKAGWTEAEDRMVLLAVRTFGTQWNAVSDQLVGRTADAVRRGVPAQMFRSQSRAVRPARTA